MKNLKIYPVTPDRWADFAKLFGKRGACAGCWCMFLRQTRKEFEQRKGESNRRAMKRLIDNGHIPGLLAYDGDLSIGWCSIAEREHFPSLDRSRVSARVDDKPVWSAVCFFVNKAYRNQGVTVSLLKEAIKYVKKNGGKIVEGYPIEPKKDRYVDTFAYHGLKAAFEEVGFVEVARNSETRPIMRYYIK